MTVESNPAMGAAQPAASTSLSAGARADEGAAAVAGQFSAGYRSYALVLLLVIYVFNFIDRSIVNILAEPIKDELDLADWHIGLMSGFAFAIFYSVLGLPIARLAEVQNRPVIISIALATWSGFTAISGLAQNFWHLVLARIGVGVGEAGCTPPAHSLITDYVPRERRASALAFYSAGIPIGSMIGTAAGGLIADAYGWRWAFVVCGLPGVVLAIVAVLTLVEPRAKALMKQVRAVDLFGGQSLREAMAVFATKRTFWLVALAAAIKAFIGYGHAPFTASFFLRNHTQEIADLATSYGLKSVGFVALAIALISGTAAIFGALLGGWIADRYGGRDFRAYVSVPGVAAVVTIPIYIFAVTTSDPILGIFTLAINAILGTLWYGPVYTIGQSIVPAHLRATAAAILLFVINLIGLGLGPLAVGVLSDVLATYGGLGKAEGLRWSLILSSLMGVVAFIFFWMARKTIREEMES